ncbi:MAG: hypothetical protein KIT66_03735 [Chitinophagaceae bacterium]|nr:hypothetical protein [Chitinophagaceae bacterium]
MNQIEPKFLKSKIISKRLVLMSISSPGLISPQPFMELNTYAGMDNQLNIYGFRD